MLGREKAVFHADFFKDRQLSLVVECGSAIGYLGLWIADTHKANEKGCLLTVEMNQGRVEHVEAQRYIGDYRRRSDGREGPSLPRKGRRALCSPPSLG